MMTDSVIQFRGTIYENGYGLLAQKVMRDKTLPKQSKLIYAYMCSFAGVNKEGERTAFPSVKLQCAELGMSEDTYYKWRKPLIEKGLITIEKRREADGTFERNLYFIEAVPVPREEEKVSEDIKPKKEKKQPHPKKSGTAPYPKKSSTDNPSTVNSGTNINSSTINSSTIEEEEELITLSDVISFMNEQISKREIENKKTIDAIFEVAHKCRAIGTNDREAMENYCITIVEEKMQKFGQKQRTAAPAGGTGGQKPIREEMLPEWFDKEEEERPKESKVDIEKNKREIEEMLKKLRA